jgi:hypothetical protein
MVGIPVFGVLVLSVTSVAVTVKLPGLLIVTLKVRVPFTRAGAACITCVRRR